MMNRVIPAFFFSLVFYCSYGQDSTFRIGNKMVHLSEIIIRSDVNVPRFIKKVQEDSTFYKAFKNLRILNYSAINDIRMLDKKGKAKASLHSKTKQTVHNGCRTMQVLESEDKGNMFDKKGDWNYYTAEMYAQLFFTKDTICGENNIVGDLNLSLKNKHGIEKHKEQLKMLFFNPGKRIPGIPFIGNKIDIFEHSADKYDFSIDYEEYRNEMCYVFTIRTKKDITASQKNKAVIDEMTTWLDPETMAVRGRTYKLSYNTGLYDFDVWMEVQMSRFKEMVVPSLIRYVGDWDVPFKKRERGVFTAVLYDFGSG